MSTMANNMRVMTILVTALAVGVVTGAVQAQEAGSKAETASVVGKWTLSVSMPDNSMTAGMTLAQDGAKVTGTFTSDHTGEAPIKGRFTNGTLTFAITVHGGGGAAMQVDFTGKIKGDGTLAGALTGQMGEMSWSATRVKQVGVAADQVGKAANAGYGENKSGVSEALEIRLGGHRWRAVHYRRLDVG